MTEQTTIGNPNRKFDELTDDEQVRQINAIFGKPEPKGQTGISEYRPESFSGGAASYAGQGICSICGEHLAKWQEQRGAVLIALCSDCLN